MINPDYNMHVRADSAKVGEKKQEVRRAKRPPANIEGKAIEEKTVDRMTQEVKKVSSKEKAPVSSARKIAGKRIYHEKRDILPWITNMYESGKRSNEYVYEKFEKLINQSSNITNEEKESLINDAKRRLEFANQKLLENMNEMLESPELSGDLGSALIPDKEIVQKYKDTSKSIQKNIHDNVKGFAKGLEKVRIFNSESPPLPLKEEISSFVKDIEENVGNIEGLKRFEIIHEDEFWNPEHITKRYMGFSNEQLETSIMGVSTFQAVGPGYSSQAPRNRTQDSAVAANFVRTTYSVKSENSDKEPEKVLDVTRSAITVEFDQPDPVERKKCNQKLVKQIVMCQVEHQLAQTSEEEIKKAQNRNTPIIFKGQVVNLLTPDIMRTMAREHETVVQAASYFNYHMSGAPADDERTLMLENIEAYQSLDGKILTMKANIDGEEKDIYVKLDLRYFNIPNNTMYLKTPKILTDTKEATDANMSAWGKLETDARQNIDGLTKEIEKKVKSLPQAERKQLNALLQKENIKNRLRDHIAGETIDEGKEYSQKSFEHWQKLGDELVEARRKIENDDSSSEELKEILKLCTQRSNLIDLYLDTKELFLSGLSKDVKNMDNNRSALATRLILLGSMVEDVEVHFGCRSGKDRTGLVDIELKLLLTEAELNGRMPSYREEERLPEIINHREIMTLESGNSYDFVKANLGAALGLNTGGSASDPFEKNEAGKQYEEFTQAVQAFASMASRPPTNWQIPPANFGNG